MSALHCQAHRDCYRMLAEHHHETVDDLWRCRACLKRIAALHPYLGVRP